MPYIIYVILSALLMIPGLIGVVFLLPGIPFMFVIALVLAYIDRFNHLTSIELIILGIIAGFSFIIDNVLGLAGAKLGGASKKAMIGGIVGFILGSIVLPPFGGFVGLFLGVLIMEIFQFKEYRAALKSATGGLLGSLAGILVNLILGVLFIILFLIFAL